MKNILNITMKLSCSCLLLILSACSGFLDREPLDQLTEDAFYRNLEEVDLAMVSVYTPMMDTEWNGKAWMITEIPSDNTRPGGTDPEFTPVDNFTVNPDTPPVVNFWWTRYRQVTYANIMIEKIINLDNATAEEKAPFIGEAKFLRALAYFDLVRIYGAVPLITNSPKFGEELLFPRAPVEDVYALIIDDFTAGAESLPMERTSGLGRATKGAAFSYLAKVQLTRKEWVKARDAAQAVVDLNVYKLMEDYGDNWKLGTSDNNAESVFQIQFAGCGQFGTGNPLQAFFAPWGEGITKDRDGWGSQIPTGGQDATAGTTIQDVWEPGDLRKKYTIMTPGEHYPEINPGDGGYTYPSGGASSTNANIRKYVVGSASNICFMSTPQNTHMMRYSDVLLMLAEAITQIQGGETINETAVWSVNEVRQRAGLELIDKSTLEIIEQERRVELAFEGHRWFDLVRTGKALETLLIHGKNIQAHNLLFPIPSSEIAVNPKLSQNPGY